MLTFNLFVYGTLMRGFRANSFIPEESEMLKGKIAGNLYHYSAGFPIVEILKHPQSIIGTRDYIADIAKQNDLNRVEPECLPFNLNYGRVYGELYKIPYTDNKDDESIIRQLDSYEGFRPSSEYNLYNRTLVPVQTDKKIIWAWVYNMDKLPETTVHILSGDWRDCFYSNRGGLRPEIKDVVNKKLMLLDDEEDDEYEYEDLEEDEE